MEIPDAIPLDDLPIFLVKEIIKKMELKSVIRLQKTTKWCDELVQKCHSPVLDKYHKVAKIGNLIKETKPWKGKRDEITFLAFTAKLITLAIRKAERQLLSNPDDEEIFKILEVFKRNLATQNDLRLVWTAIFDSDGLE